MTNYYCRRTVFAIGVSFCVTRTPYISTDKNQERKGTVNKVFFDLTSYFFNRWSCCLYLSRPKLLLVVMEFIVIFGACLKYIYTQTISCLKVYNLKNLARPFFIYNFISMVGYYNEYTVLRGNVWLVIS